MSEKLLLLKQIKNKVCNGVVVRSDDGSVDLHFNKIVVQIDSLDNIFVSSVMKTIEWKEGAWMFLNEKFFDKKMVKDVKDYLIDLMKKKEKELNEE